MQPES
jgi:hypothetical protein